jgi:signal transduction histidine kinase
MNFRRRLLAVFALTVFLSVGAVTVIVSAITRRAFERSDQEQTAALVAQFRREFDRQGQEVVHRVEAIAASDAVTRMALALSRESPDYGAYVSEAKAIADNQQLDFLEFFDGKGSIISSAQAPAKFGYQETWRPIAASPLEGAFLKEEDLPAGPVLGLFALREVRVGDKPLFVIGGWRFDKFLDSLELPAGMRVMLYEIPGSPPPSHPKLPLPDDLAKLIRQVQLDGRETSGVSRSSSGEADDETVHALPLSDQDKQLHGVLLIFNSRRRYVELRQHIRSAALLAGGAGIVLAILLSGWAAARVTRPVEQLAAAAREVAAGNWDARVQVTSADELGALAESFNRMTAELLEQRERLVQAERVAAWRELARRLAHELKNPLFPLQLTVENLLRARQQSPHQFEEVFREGASTLLAEIANLKTIVARFSEFSKMPQPQMQPVELNEAVRNGSRLFQAQLKTRSWLGIECKLDLDENLEPIAADSELLHRALSNLIVNAMDAMPEGGTLTLRTLQEGERAILEVSDTGAGLTPEECERLFTPYYTTKAHGTGLGLAIVQSVVSDHGGRITVHSEAGAGTTFRIELPRNLDKLRAGEPSRTSNVAT